MTSLNAVQGKAGTRHQLLWAVGALSLIASCAWAAEDESMKLAPPYRELAPPFWETYGMWILAGVIVLLVAALVFLKLRRSKVQQEALSPAARARKTLEPLVQRPEDDLVLVEVSAALRHYLAAVCPLPSGELTTTKLLRHLEAEKRLSPATQENIGQLLRACDQRKFGPKISEPPLGAAQKALDLVAAVEQETQPPPPVTPIVDRPAVQPSA